MKGRKPTPAAIKEANGNPGKRPIKKLETPENSGLPEKPSFLNGISAAMWAEVVDVLNGMDLLRKSDGVALQLFCTAYAQWRESEEAIEKNGLTYEATNTQGDLMIRANPQVKIAAEAWRRVQSMLAEFGMTPAARARLGEVGGEKDELSKLLNKMSSKKTNAAKESKLASITRN